MEVRDDLQPVVLGGDIGAYSLARQFHERYGVRSVVVSSAASGAVRDSVAVRHVVEPGLDDPEIMVSRLREIAARRPESHLLLLASADRHVRQLVTHRDRLEDLFTLPYADLGLLMQMTDKVAFGRLCAELDIAHPRTVVADVGSGEEPDTSGLSFPVFAKAASTVAYHGVAFPGKRKGFEVANRPDLLDLLSRVREAGYDGEFLVQDLIPGNDSGMRILTCYSDTAGKVRYSGFGHVLLEEHTPGAIGNPAAIITGRDDAVVAQATRLLEHVGWTGYANFDIKHDPRDGRLVFFELNPRLGRSNYYMTCGGQNPVELYVREQVDGRDPLPPGARSTGQDEHLYTVLPLRLLMQYVDDPLLRERIRMLRSSGRVTNPLLYIAERNPRRLAYLAAAHVNQYRKFHRHYPPNSTRAAVVATR